MPLNGRHPYEVSKSCADLIAQAYHHTYGLRVAIARCGNIYGGGDLNWSRIVPQTVQALLRGESPIIRSDGTYVRDYIYVKDVTRAYMHLAESLNEVGVPGEAFNFSTESPLTVLALVQVIQRLMAFEQVAPQILNQAEGEIRNQSLSTDKVRTLLAWQPRFNLEQGLTETIAWYRVFLAN
jgi:CDP-glucose 4,6-dehydratase